MLDAHNQEIFQRIVGEILEQINLGTTPEELFHCIYDRFHNIVPYNRIAVALLDETGEHLELISCRSDGDEALKIGYSDPIHGSTLKDLLQTGQPRIINDLEEYLTNKPDSRSTRLIVREGMRSNLTLPLLANGRPLGVIFFSSRTTNSYSPEHVHLLRQVAGHIAITIEKSRLLIALEAQNEELLQANQLKDQFLQQLQEEVQRQTADLRQSEQHYRAMAQMGLIVTAGLDLREVFRRAAVEVHNIIQCDRVSLILIEQQNQQRQGFALDFGNAQEVVDIPVQSLTGSAAEWVHRHQQSRIVMDLQQSRPFVEDRKLAALGYQGYVYLPLICGSAVVGAWGLATRQVGEITKWDLPLLHELCTVMASALDNAAAYEQVAQLTERLEQENTYLRNEARKQRGDLIGNSRSMREVIRAIDQVAPTDSTVLILGETGTGKERVARAIHEQSTRREQLLVTVNCAALSPSLIAAELFGHEAGAFTGAVQSRPGRFEIAHQGTLFLDEIAEIPIETQVLLLRALQERTIERVGTSEPRAVDVRIIAATNRDLQQGIKEGWFRADLYYRLHVFPLTIPPLRDRLDDLPALTDHFVTQICQRMRKPVPSVSNDARALLAQWQWPGNVREMENLIERALIVMQGDVLKIDPAWLPQPTASLATAGSLADLERQSIIDALKACNGKIYGTDGAAAHLGLKPSTLYGKMRKHGISRNQSFQ